MVSFLLNQAANDYDVVKMLTGLLKGQEATRENVKNLFEKGFTYPGVLEYVDLKPGEHDIIHPLFPAQLVDGELRYLR
jgi:hypothetical protein